MVYIYKNRKRLGRLFVKKSSLLLFSWTSAERRLAWLVEKIFRHWDAAADVRGGWSPPHWAEKILIDFLFRLLAKAQCPAHNVQHSTQLRRRTSPGTDSRVRCLIAIREFATSTPPPAMPPRLLAFRLPRTSPNSRVRKLQRRRDQDQPSSRAQDPRRAVVNS